jgi:aspartyl-tRNA(Asn)/glutamyl-tRNA(Gln) amidotransferase subunit C
MGKLTDKEILHIAKLARLDLSPEEIKTFSVQLSNVIDYVGQLKEVKTNEVESIDKEKYLKNIYREDKINEDSSLNVEEALSGTENHFNNYFKVKAIFEK